MTAREPGRLTDDEREALLRPCACGHTLNDHGSLVACWRCEDDGSDCTTLFEALLAERLEGIVAREVAEALREVADDVQEECRESDAPCFCGSADWLRDRAEQLGGAR